MLAMRQRLSQPSRTGDFSACDKQEEKYNSSQNIVILGSEHPGGGSGSRMGVGGGLRDANYSKSYSTQKISENPRKN